MPLYFNDLSLALRRMTRRKGTTLLAVLMLALGIGATTALYSIVHAVMFRPLQVHEPERLVFLQHEGYDTLTYPDFALHREQNRAFSHMLLSQTAELNLLDQDSAQAVSGAFVSPDYFQTLGIRPSAGQFFHGDDEKAWSRAIVIGHDLATQRFDRPENALGKSLRIGGHTCLITGIAPQGFRGLDPLIKTQIWMPFSAIRTFRPPAKPDQDQQSTRTLPPSVRNHVVGRLKPGFTLAQAQDATRALCQNMGDYIAKLHPDPSDKLKTRLVELNEKRRQQISSVLPRPTLLFVACALLVLLACANLANLLLAESSGRKQEFALRVALGAPSLTLFRQLMTESLMLSLLGAISGLCIGQLLAQSLLHFQAASFHAWNIDVSLNPMVTAFALAMALLCTLIFGLLPALQLSNPKLFSAMKPGAERWRLKKLLLIVQVALSLTLLVSSGILLKTLRQIKHQDLGYAPKAVATLRLHEGAQGYTPEQSQDLRHKLMDRLQNLPGVQSAALAASVPKDPLTIRIQVKLPEQSEAFGCPWGLTGPGYFKTMGIPLLKGRDFSLQDEASERQVAIINEAFANKHFPGQEALGKTLGRGRMQIIGIVGNTDQDSIYGKRHPMIYTPLTQSKLGFTGAVIKTQGRPETLLPTLRKILSELAPELPVTRLVTLEQHLDQVTGPLRLAAWLLGGFGILSLTLASLGVYAIQSFRVNQKRREIGVLMALGATPGQIALQILKTAALLTLTGLGLGAFGSFALTQILGSQLTGLPGLDLRSLLEGSGILFLTALLASLVPALRAACLQPAKVLKSE